MSSFSTQNRSKERSSWQSGLFKTWLRRDQQRRRRQANLWNYVLLLKLRPTLTSLFNRMEIVEMSFIRVQPKHNKGLSFNQQNRLLLQQSYYEIKCVTIETIFFLFVCISVSMSSFKFLERHNKVTKREQYIFGSHLDQHFKYQIVDRNLYLTLIYFTLLPAP